MTYKHSKAFDSFWTGIRLSLDKKCYTFKMCLNEKFYIAAKPVRNKLCMHVYCMETTINTKDNDGTWLQKHCKAWLETITLVFIFFLPIFCTISIIYKLLNSLPFNFGRKLYRCLYTSSVTYIWATYFKHDIYFFNLLTITCLLDKSPNSKFWIGRFLDLDFSIFLFYIPNQYYVQLDKYETAPNFIQLNLNMTSDCLLIYLNFPVFLPVLAWCDHKIVLQIITKQLYDHIMKELVKAGKFS